MKKIDIICKKATRMFDAGEYKDALECFTQGFKLEPNNESVLVGLGVSLLVLGQHSAGEKFLNTAIAKYGTLLGLKSLADFYRRTGKTAELKTILNIWHTNYGDGHEYFLYRGILEFRIKNYSEALEILCENSVGLSRKQQGLRHQIIGLILEKQGRYDEAMTAFSEMNKIAAPNLQDSMNYANYVDKLNIESRVVSMGRSFEEVFFMVGMPRSGTTLLESIITSHKEIEDIQEKALLEIVRENYKNSSSKHVLDSQRLDYIKYLDGYKMDKTATFSLDKYPLNIVHLDLINALFPENLTIVCIRHPADVVLSCYKQFFEPNPAMNSFTDLNSTIYLYDKVMSRFDAIRELISPNILIVRYEDVIADHLKQVEPVFKFLGLSINDDVKNYRENISNKVIETPSASQVTQPLYNSSVGNFRNYSRLMTAENFPLLKYWIDKFGYEL